MENISDIANNVVSNTTTGQQPEHQSRFTKEERAPIAYFFVRLSEIYGIEYNRHVPDSAAEVKLKREWGDDLKHYTKPQLDKGLAFIKKQMTDGSGEWVFLNVGRCIWAIRDANRFRAAHKALPAPKPTKLSKAERAEKMAAMRLELNFDKPAEGMESRADRDLRISKAKLDLLERGVVEK